MSEGDRSRTTYALARVTTSSGRSEIWIASAGKKDGYQGHFKE